MVNPPLLYPSCIQALNDTMYSRCVDFSIEDDVVVSGGEKGRFIAWRLSTGEQLADYTFK